MDKTTSRNWLIRTGQNQILGPVSKEKIAEFINKGTLSLMDEVSSGNGFWFYIREKELVDRHIFGDVPQGYNPISEAKTVLANNLKSDVTTSINAAPINAVDDRRHQKTQQSGKEVLPSSDDLEYPDLTVVGIENPLKAQSTSLPTNEDLEYPTLGTENTGELEITIVQARENAPEVLARDELSFELPEEYTIVASKDSLKKEKSEVANLPNQEDLEYPDLNQVRQAIVNEVPLTKSPAQSPAKKGYQEFEAKEAGGLELNREYTSTIAISEQQLKEILPKKEEAKKVSAPEKKIQLHERKKIVETKEQEKKITKPQRPKSGESMRDPRRERAYSETHEEKSVGGKRSDNYLFLILFLIILILGAVFYYFKEILNKPFI